MTLNLPCLKLFQAVNTDFSHLYSSSKKIGIAVALQDPELEEQRIFSLQGGRGILVCVDKCVADLPEGLIWLMIRTTSLCPANSMG